MGKPVTYDRPVQARLVVMLDNDESWDATPEDLKRFNLVSPSDIFNFADKALDAAIAQAGDRDVTEVRINPLRRLFEIACIYQHIYGEGESHHTTLLSVIKNIAGLEALLAEALTCEECGSMVESVGQDEEGDAFGFVCALDGKHTWRTKPYVRSA